MKLPLINEEVLTLIPQRRPMVMVDRFDGLREEDGVSVSGLTVREDNLFCRDGYLCESGVIEHMAQSAAARAGYLCVRDGQPVPLGFIGSVDKLTIHALPQVGDVLHTEIAVMQEVMNVNLVRAEVRVGDTLLADCRMKIVLNPQ